jgi:hypothetical protein
VFAFLTILIVSVGIASGAIMTRCSFKEEDSDDDSAASGGSGSRGSVVEADLLLYGGWSADRTQCRGWKQRRRERFWCCWRFFL